MTNKMIQEIIDYLESGERFGDILVKELDRTDLKCYEKRTYSSLLDALNGATELYCAMTEWPDNVEVFIKKNKKEDMNDELIAVKHGPQTMEAVKQVSTYVGGLTLSNEQNDKLIDLMCKQLVTAEQEAFIQGFTVCMNAIHNGGFKGLEDEINKVVRYENGKAKDIVKPCDKTTEIQMVKHKEKPVLVFNTVCGKDDLKELRDCTVYHIEDVENTEKNFYGTEFIFRNEVTGKYIGLLKDNDGELSMSQWY